MLGIKIPKFKSMSIKNDILKYDEAKILYIPLVNGVDTDITVLVKKGEHVYKGDIIGKTKGNFRIPIHASVSGTVIDFVEKTYLNGMSVKCVAIENDFKEEVSKELEVSKKINEYTKEEFIDLIQDKGIIGMGGSGFPTYVKYDTDKKIRTLIVNAVECEPYITSDYVLLKEKCEEILEAIDAIIEINNIDEAIIAIKKTNIELKEILDNFIGTYLKIKIVLVPNLYPMGWERSLIRYIKKQEYQKLPIECGIVVNNVSTIYAIYEALKEEKPLIDRVVTFTGEMLKNPINVIVKVGTQVDDVIEFIGGYKRYKDIVFIAGGPMMGSSLKSDDLVVSANLNCVLGLKDTVSDPTIDCLRCGKCVNVCPSKLSPVLIMENRENKEALKELLPIRCIECGLCSYVCPSKIYVRNFVKDAKANLNK